MRDFNNRGRSSGPRRFDSRGGSDRPQMHRATCSNCGNACEVPFRPNGSKPVLCSDCFKSGGNSDRRNDTRSFGRPNNEERQMYNAVCSNCGNECQIPFQPRDGRPVFCSRCFEKNEGQGFDRKSSDTHNRNDSRERSNTQPNYEAQFEALNAKMDKILSLLNNTPTQQVESQPLESILDNTVIDEIVEEIEEQKVAKAPKKEKKVVKKPTKTVKKVAKKD